MEDLIFGSGGKGRSRKPQNDEDNLNSIAIARILEVISEGEIAGFATPLEDGHTEGTTNYNTIGQKDIFFNRTSLLKPSAGTSPANDDYNFTVTDLRIDTRVGKGTEADQTVINGFSDIRSVVSAFPNDDLVNKDEFKVLTFTDTAAARVSQVIVIITIPALFATYNNGDVRGLKTHYEISRSISNVNGGAFATPPGMSVIVDGRTNDPFQQQHPIDIPPTDSTAVRTIQIKVAKRHGDHTDKNIIQQAHNVRFTSIVKVIDDERHYLNSALVGLQLDAENFSSVPKRTYKVKGIKIRIPGAGANNSGTPTVDIKTGRIDYPSNYIFNGTMQAAQFCACPVFVLYDILTSRRYGFGDQILTPSEQADFSSGVAANIDLYSFVEASKYSNTLVSDRRTNAASIAGTYVQAGNLITITFTSNSGLQTGDLITADFTGVASDITDPIRILLVFENKTKITLGGGNGQTGEGNVTVFKGNTEPRFSFNGVINKQEDAFKLLNKVASVFRGAIYVSEGKIKLTQDRPADPTYLFNRSNVTQEGFSYEGSDVKTRSNCVVVRFFNNITQKIDYEQHPLAENTDPSSSTFDPFVKAYGLNKKQVDAFGCTSAGQASRLARFIYYTENFLTETCTFTTTSDAGVMIRPGMIISISDPVRSGTRLAGRITAATTSSITVDSISGISFTSGDELSVVMPDGKISKRPVTGISGSVISVSFNFAVGDTATAPNVNSVWLYEKTTAAPTTWRIISVEQSENLQYAVTALTYNSNLYNTIELGTSVVARDITTLDEKVDSPSALTVRESLYKHVPNGNTFATNNGNIRIQLRVTWPAVAGAVRYKVVYTQGANTSADSDFPSNATQDNPTNVFVRRNEFELRNVESGGVYVFEVQSINAAGLTSTVPVTASHTVVGKSAPPSDVASLSATIDPNDGVGLNWLPVEPLQSNGFADLDLAGYEIRKGTDFANGTHPETGKKIEQTGTYTQSGTTITVNISNHGFLAGNQITLNFTSGKAINTTFSVTSITNTGTFVVTASNGIDPLTGNTISYTGNVTAIRESIRVQATNLFLPVEFVKTTSTFMVKAYDTSGNFSTNAASVTVTINDPSAIVNPVQPSPTPSPLNTGAITTAENGVIKIRWNEPETSTYKIKNYKITNNNNSDVIFADTTEFQTPGTWVDSQRTFTIRAVNIAGNEGATTDVPVNIPLPAAPSNLNHSFTTDSVVLKWEEAASVGALQPPVIGYRIFRNEDFSSSIAQVKATEFSLLVNNTNFSNVASGKAQSSYQIAAVYADPAFPTDGRASSNRASISVSIDVAAAPPNQTFSFELDFVIVKWNEVNAADADGKGLKTIRYGIFDNQGSLITEADSTEFRTKANFSTKTIQIKALSAAYINAAGDGTAQGIFIGAGSDLTITRDDLLAPENGSYKLSSSTVGDNAGLGFVTISWTPPVVTPANNLDLKDFKIIRSSSDTFANISDANTELTFIQDTESFKEEVSWVISSGNAISKYYYIIPRDFLDNEGTALKIEVIIEKPSTPRASLVGQSEVIDNNVLLRWREGELNTATQLKIATFEIRKHESTATDINDFASATVIGRVDGVFNVVFEQKKEVYTYHIAAVDTAGNISNSFTTTQSVAQPPDFVLNDDFFSNFTTSPAKILSNSTSNCFIKDAQAYIPANTTETWAEHFTSNSKTTLQGLINAGNLNYLEPAPSSGFYEEVYDFGANLASTKISAIQSGVPVGSGSIVNKGIINIANGTTGAFTTDGVEQTGTTFFRFGTTFRRVKYRTIVESTNGQYRKIESLNLKLDTKLLNDTGQDEATYADSNGTGKQQNFNVPFVDVQGINVTPNGNGTNQDGSSAGRKIIAVVDFVDDPNPTGFKVFLFDVNGNPVGGKFTWQCRGT